MGSGTTAVAAMEAGRDFIGFEISEQYHRVATDRLKGITKRERDSGNVQLKLF